MCVCMCVCVRMRLYIQLSDSPNTPLLPACMALCVKSRCLYASVGGCLCGGLCGCLCGCVFACVWACVCECCDWELCKCFVRIEIAPYVIVRPKNCHRLIILDLQYLSLLIT